MSDRGYFLLYRGWRQSDVFKDEPLTEREAWVWLIEEAAYKPREREIAGKVVRLDRGEVGASLTFLERAWRWSRDRVRWFLSKLEKHGMVTTTKRGGVTVIALANYSAFQPRSKGENHPTANTTPSTTANTTADAAENCEEPGANPTGNPTPSTTANTTNENEGLVMKGSNSGGRAQSAQAKRKPPDGHRLPEDWQPKIKHYELGRELNLGTSEVDFEADKFRDCFLAKPGKEGRKTDWDRTFNNWLRNSLKYGKRTPAGQPSPAYRQQAGGVTGVTGKLMHGSGG